MSQALRIGRLVFGMAPHGRSRGGLSVRSSTRTATTSQPRNLLSPGERRQISSEPAHLQLASIDVVGEAEHQRTYTGDFGQHRGTTMRRKP
jgi:hypothetical protein